MECEFFYQVGNYVVLQDLAEIERNYDMQHRRGEDLGGRWHVPEAIPPGEGAMAERLSGFYIKAES